MKRTALPLTVVAVAVALVALLVYGLNSKAEDRSLDSKVAAGVRVPAPSRELPVLGRSGTQSLADYRGKVVLLNFWASWCGPCKEEAPLLRRTQQRIAGHEATILGVSYNDNVPDAEGFNRRYHLTYPTLRDIGTKLAHDYGTNALPESFLIDRRGRIAAIHRGQLDQAWVDAHVIPLLSQ